MSSVRGPLKTPLDAAVVIQFDANALPPNDEFMITPNTTVDYVDFRKVAIAKDPYVLYKTRVNAAEYIVNANRRDRVEGVHDETASTNGENVGL